MLLATIALSTGFAGAEARIESFSPTGHSKSVRQVAVRFSEPMVALGDPSRTDPFGIDCEVPGRGRWVDERNWVYDFEYEMPGAVRCRFGLRDGLETLSGVRVQSPTEYAFHTGGPSILAHQPDLRSKIDERQVFLLLLDAMADLDSVRQHARCRLADGVEEHPVDLVEGAERTEILEALSPYYYLSMLLSTAENHLPPDVDHKSRAIERILMVRCPDPLPSGSDMELIWGTGIAAPNGLATLQDQTMAFSVRPSPRAYGGCWDSFKGRCVGRVHVRFSDPIPRESADRVRLTDPDGTIVPGEIAETMEIRYIEYPAASHDDTTYRAELLGPIRDIYDRPLVNASDFPATIRVGRWPPGANFGRAPTVVEYDEDATAPVLLRRIARPLAGSRLHIEGEDAEIVAWMRRIAEAWNAKPNPWRGLASSRSVFGPDDDPQRFALPVEASDEPFRFAGVPLPGRGFHVLQLDLPASPDFPARYVAGMALATNSAIHFHRAEESSLAWVTRLADGRPVDGAEVRVSAACTGRMLARGATDADGIARIPTALAWVDDCAGFRYLVTARKDGDLALATFGLPRDTEPRPTILFHTILDRSLYRPGETVSMKVILRRASSDGFALPAGLPAPGRVVIEHVPTGKQREIAIDFAADGSAVATFELPLDTRLGRYALSVEFAGHESPFSYLRVEQFRLGAMRASVDGPDKPVVNPRWVPVNLSVEHLAGGGAAALPVTVRWVVKQWGYYWESIPPPPEPVTMSAILDAAGKATVDVPTPPLVRRAMLDVEMDYQDANGQRKTASSYFELWPAEVMLRITGHETPAGVRLVRLAVRDSDDAPVPDVAVQAKVYQTRDSRLRWLPGGFTGRVASGKVKTPLMATCSGATDAAGTLDCELPPEAPSSAFVEATAHDAQGNEATAAGNAYFRIDDPGPAFLEVDSGRVFDVGDAVPVQVNLPYAEAMALVTVQREGLPTAFVTRMSGPKATVEVPVKKHYAPNFDVSVLAIPAGSEVAGDPRLVVADTVDVRHSTSSAGRPDFRHDKVSVRVNPEPYALTVRVEPHRDRYRPRERARVSITVLGPAGLPARDVDLALVAVDEALLELWPNRTWDLLDTMTQWRSARVDTTTSLAYLSPTLFDELVPAQEFVMVSAPGLGPHGRDENAEALLRQRFEPTLLWRGRVALGEGTTVEVDVPLNDSLTSFRIVAIAAAGDDLFGTGEARIRTTQDLILHGGLPEVVREGDRFRASFTVRNASDVRRRVDVAAEIEGIGVLPRKRLRLRPGRSREVAWPVTAPAGVGRMAWQVTARSGSAVDRLAARQLVEPIVPVRVQQAILTQLATLRELPVKPPAKALPGRGGIRVSLQPSLAGSLHTVQEAMARYRYTCLEQKVSAAIVLEDPERWSAAMAFARTSLDGDGLLRFFPSASLSGSPILTAYVLAIADAAGNDIPDDLRDSMIEGLKEYVAGRITRVGVLGAADSHLRRLSALAALARYDALDDDMVATVTEHQLEVLPTSALLDLIDIVEHLDPDRSELAFAKATLRSRLSLQGTTMGFSTENRDRLWWLMVSTDGNAARSILSLMGDAEWQQDLPRMMRGLFGRQQRGRWQTTVANAWGTVAAAKFATAFEPVAVTGASVVRLGEERRRAAWPSRDDRTASADAPPPIQLPWSAAQVLSLAHEGTGAPWGLVELRAAVPLTQPVSRGYRIARRMEPVDPAKRRAWARGGVAQIILDIDATADMTWVVVEDPLPPGTVVLGSGLGGDSSLLAARHKSVDRWPVFTERDVDSYRAYYRYVPKGRTTLRYNVRYNTAGRFQLPPTRVEAMYAPEMHAEMPLKPITIR